MLWAIADLYQVSIDYLVNRTDDRKLAQSQEKEEIEKEQKRIKRTGSANGMAMPFFLLILENSNDKIKLYMRGIYVRNIHEIYIKFQRNSKGIFEKRCVYKKRRRKK